MHVAAAREFIFEKLKRELPGDLFYHGIHHTVDVTKVALQIANREGVCDQTSLGLLETAALYHDCGFIYTYQDHEEAGCSVVRDTLPLFGYTADHIQIICGLIMATKLPQTPRTYLEDIICDADLDYLGRPDFKAIGDTLFQELLVRNKVTDIATWNKRQVDFLSQHSYKTKTSQELREMGKQSHLSELKKGLL